MNARIGASEKPNPKNMKTLLLTALTLTGITLCTPKAQARDHKHHESDHRSYRCESRSRDYGYSHGYDAPRISYSRSYHCSEPSYYYRPAPRYYYSERCEPERRRHSFRPPLISFLFGF